MKEKIRIGYVGLGRRGISMLKSTFGVMPDVEIAAVCETRPEKMEEGLAFLKDQGAPEPRRYADYRELVRDPAIDAVVVMTGWNTHIPVALAALRAGKYTAMEVGTAYDLSECFDLVKAHEETGAPLMMLENCCYGRREMMALRMVKEGLFGELVHAEGGYHHYLNECELFNGGYDGVIDTAHYRLAEYASRNCEQYPTHELGPIAKALDIGRGNRMVSLVSVASKARGLEDYMKEHVKTPHPYTGKPFTQGDVINTVITCARGETIHISLDTTLPRPYYSRAFELRGTRGGCVENAFEHATFWLPGMGEELFDNEKEFFEKYDHPLHREYVREGERGGHGGIDWLVTRAFAEAVKNGTDTPINAYDTAAWLSVGPLSEISIRQGGAPVAIPDFTRGKWIRPGEPLHGKYSLDEVKEYPDIPIFPS